MATVLLVEDEDTLRDSVARYLELEGHEVLSASNGREAFDLGLAGTPDVLVADWMLRNHIHGLHVAQTLRCVDPHLRTVLITGFPSRNLESEFESSGVLQMLEKPFDLSDLNRAVLEAADRDESEVAQSAAVLEVEVAGRIAFASGGARLLLGQTAGGADCEDLGEVLGPDFAALLGSAERHWTPAEPRGATVGWMMRTRPRRSNPGWIVALCREDEPRWLTDPRLRILLDHHSRSAPLLPDLGPVIVLECDGAVRRLLASQVERIGALCYLADDLPSALRLLAAEPRASSVLLDVDTAGDAFPEWARAIHETRADVRVVGTGASGSADRLLALGIDRILEKPWRIEELVAALAE